MIRDPNAGRGPRKDEVAGHRLVGTLHAIASDPHRVWAVLLVFLAAVVTATTAAGNAAAAAGSTSETRVKAPAPVSILLVGPTVGIAAGQRLDRGPPQAQVAQGRGVHTYYVVPTGSDGASGTTAVLVHNADDPTAASNAARREVMRKAGIPTSQQPISQKRYSAGYGRGSGYQYVYEVNGKRMLVTDNWHDLNADKPHGPHWEAGESKGKGVRDSLGRERVKSGKFTSFYRAGC